MKNKTFIAIHFIVFQPKLWNTLQDTIDRAKTAVKFKKNLKTYLFKQYIDQECNILVILSVFYVTLQYLY